MMLQQTEKITVHFYAVPIFSSDLLVADDTEDYSYECNCVHNGKSKNVENNVYNFLLRAVEQTKCSQISFSHSNSVK